MQLEEVNESTSEHYVCTVEYDVPPWNDGRKTGSWYVYQLVKL